MIRDIVMDDNPLIKEISKPVEECEFNTQELDNLIIDMRETMHYKNGVGIAAVQIGILKRISVIEFNDNNLRYSQIGNWPFTVVINPEIEVIGDETCTRDEGCLSISNFRGAVTRAKRIRYKFYDATGELITGETDSFFARVLQHEIDHMNGILFPSRISAAS